MGKKGYVHCRVGEILSARVSKAAEVSGKSVSEWVRWAIEGALDRPAVPVTPQHYTFPDNLEPLGYSSVGDGGVIGQRLNEDLANRKKAWDRASTRETGDAEIDEFLLSEGRQKPPGWVKWALPRRKAWFLTGM